jgi:hypothetical protein
VKSHAKAPSTGSTKRQASGRGRFASLSIAGLLLVLSLLACLAPAVASASVAHEYEKSFGPDGTSASHFISPGPVAVDQATHEVYVADLEAKAIEKFDQNGAPANFSALGTSKIHLSELTGPGEALAEIAVNSSSHAFYVTYGYLAIKAFQQDGEPAEFTAGPGAGSNELPAPPGGEICGVAVDSNGDIYMGDYQSGVHVFEPSGEEITSFETEHPCNVAVDSHGAVYVDHYVFDALGIEKFIPSEFPVTASTTYSSAGFADENAAFALTIDPSNNDLYAVEYPEAGETSVVQYDEGGNFLGKFAETDPGALTKSEGVAVDGTTEKVYVSDTEGEKQVEIWAPPPPEPPEVESTSVTNITTTSANLQAQVNPKSFDTHYHFQYITQAQFEASGFAGAAETPEVDLGSAAVAQTAHGFAGGLVPDTAYRFRVIAENANGEATSPEPAPRFNTFPAFPPGLPDNRAYEMVSPPQKLGEVFPPIQGVVGCKECLPGINNQLMPMQSAPDGEQVVYQGQPFSAGLAAGGNEYLARRGSSGWGTQSLSSPLFNEEGYRAFSPDLSRGVFFQTLRALSPEAPAQEGEAFVNLYLRSEDGSLQPLVTEEPPNRESSATSPNTFVVIYAGANAGTASAQTFSHVVFEANDALTGPTATAPAAVDGGVVEKKGFPANLNLYEWFEGQLRLVNVAPGNAATAPGAVIGSGRLLVTNNPQTEAPDVDHAISEDGSRIFWSEEVSGQVYVRIDGVETQEIDDPGKFVTASADGSKVLLSDGCLYDLEEEECEDDLAQGQGENFEGILGAAEDLSRVYFVDTAVLSGGEENANEEHAEPGNFNLYAWHEGETVFIGVLISSDNPPALGDWLPSPSNRTAQVSADGRYLAFMSKAPLTGYDNIQGGADTSCGIKFAGQPCFEAFEYDAAGAKLTCASCNPTGLRPLGGSKLSLIRGYPNLPPFPQPGNLSVAGQGRLFFESNDVLSTYDNNGLVQDVYEWEPNGVGSCKRTGGCIFLISAGHGENVSLFLDSSDSGNDAFIVTRDQLTLADKDEQLDLYDARVNGGIASETETVRSECQGEACQPAAIVPNDPTPSSSAFNGAGNVKEKPKGKHHKKKKHKRHAKKHSHKRAAKTNRGGAK